MVIPREELETAHFHVVNRREFMGLPGLLRGATRQDQIERDRVNALKRPVGEHLEALGLVDPAGRALARVVAIGSRNVGNNRGFHAWQRNCEPQHFLIRGDTPFAAPLPMLAFTRASELVVRDLLPQDPGNDIEWCVFANCVLRRGRPMPVEEIADQFYDIGHLVAVDRRTEEGQAALTQLYDGFTLRPKAEIVAAMRDLRLPRNRYLHNAIGLSAERVVILQREGTIEEFAAWLKEAGAEDGFILDNGGSVFCWAWWVNGTGGYLYRAPDFREPSSAVLALVLRGPARTALPSGSLSYTVS
jgi:hypothetical protein